MSFLKPKAATSTQSSTNESGNANNGLITGAYAPTMGAGSGATNFLAQLLGISPGGVASAADSIGTGMNQVASAGGAQQGYQNYLQMAGFAPALAQMQKGIVGQGAASGLLNSGATQHALLNSGANLNNQYFSNYLQQLSGLSSQGLQAGSLVSGAGNYSKGTSTGNSTGGGPSTLGSIASTVGGIASIFSDRRLKTDVKKVGQLSDGLPLYEYRYKGADKVHVGVMADEVKKFRPWAVGQKIQGYATVNYGAL